jgi:hypothetical protein
MTRIRTLAALGLAIPLALAACGGSSKSADPTAAAAARSASSDAPTSAHTTSSASDTAAPADGGDFCAAAQAMSARLLDTASDELDPKVAEQNLEDAVKLAPSEIRDDFQVIANLEIPIFEGSSSPSDSEFDTPQVQSAMQHIATWMQSHCGSVSS